MARYGSFLYRRKGRYYARLRVPARLRELLGKTHVRVSLRTTDYDATCRKRRAALVIGKLDRLARDVRLFLEVIDDSAVDIRFADLADVCPRTDEGRMIMVGMASFAEFEGRRIGTRTRAALAAAKARGVQLGASGAANLKRNVEQRQAAANSFAERLPARVRCVAGPRAVAASHGRGAECDRHPCAARRRLAPRPEPAHSAPAL